RSSGRADRARRTRPRCSASSPVRRDSRAHDERSCSMPKILTPEQIEAYHRDGCVFPIRVMSAAQAAEVRERLETFERSAGGPLKGDLRHKSHLLFPWLDEVVHN